MIVSHISSPQGRRTPDPCAGKGVALATLATALNLEAYGVELNQARALTAADQIQALAGRNELRYVVRHPPRFIQGDYRTLLTSKGGYNLLYLNPPYDFDQDAGRLECQWLRDCRKWLQPDGSLVYTVPQKILGYSRIARYLAAWFSRVRVYRFPNEGYPAFKQAVLFGRRPPRAQRPVSAHSVRLNGLAAAFQYGVSRDLEGFIPAGKWAEILSDLGYEPKPRDDDYYHPRPLALPNDTGNTMRSAIAALEPVSIHSGPVLLLDDVLAAALKTVDLDKEQVKLGVIEQLINNGPIGRALILLGYEPDYYHARAWEFDPPREDGG